MGRRLTEEDDRRIQELYLEHKKSILVTLCADCHKAKHRSLQTISSQASIEEGSTTIAQASTSQAIGDGNGEYPSKG